MITWTTAGAVERPTALQIRVQRSYPGRIRAGAPTPTRALSSEEIRENLRWFTIEMDRPRTRPCDRLILSGVGVAGRADTPELIQQARDWGIRTVILHAGVEDLDALNPDLYAARVDVAVVPVQPGPGGGALLSGTRAIRACQERGIRVATNTQLDLLALPEIPSVARAILATRPASANFTYPFPIAGNTSSEVPGIRAAVSALEASVPALVRAGIRVSVKGLPGCYLSPELRALCHRSGNRWYVDADHQRGEALLFFPGVVSFYKEDACRFCDFHDRCDGFFATYLRRSRFPPLRPIEGG